MLIYTCCCEEDGGGGGGGGGGGECDALDSVLCGTSFVFRETGLTITRDWRLINQVPTPLCICPDSPFLEQHGRSHKAVFQSTILRRITLGGCVWFAGETRARLTYSVGSTGYRMARRDNCIGGNALHYCPPYEHEIEDEVDAIITMRCRCIAAGDPSLSDFASFFKCADQPDADDIGYVLVFAYACPSQTEQARFYVEYPKYDGNGIAYCDAEDFYLTAGSTRAGWYAYFKAGQCVSQLVFRPLCASAGRNADEECNPVPENASTCSFASSGRIGSQSNPDFDKCFNWEEGITLLPGANPCTASFPQDWITVDQCSLVTYGSCAETSVDIGSPVIE